MVKQRCILNYLKSFVGNMHTDFGFRDNVWLNWSNPDADQHHDKTVSKVILQSRLIL